MPIYRRRFEKSVIYNVLAIFSPKCSKNSIFDTFLTTFFATFSAVLRSRTISHPFCNVNLSLPSFFERTKKKVKNSPHFSFETRKDTVMDISMHTWRYFLIIIKALVPSRYSYGFFYAYPKVFSDDSQSFSALNNFNSARARGQLFQDLAHALKMLWALLGYALILRFTGKTTLIKRDVQNSKTPAAYTALAFLQMFIIFTNQSFAVLCVKRISFFLDFCMFCEVYYIPDFKKWCLVPKN